MASGTSTSTHTSGPRGRCRLLAVQIPSSCGQPVPLACRIGTYHLTNCHGRHLYIPYTHTHSVAHMSEMAIHIFKTGHTHNCPQPVHTQTHLSSMHTMRMHTASQCAALNARILLHIVIGMSWGCDGAGTPPSPLKGLWAQ